MGVGQTVPSTASAARMAPIRRASSQGLAVVRSSSPQTREGTPQGRLDGFDR
jgi:hypothetical protein